MLKSYKLQLSGKLVAHMICILATLGVYFLAVVYQCVARRAGSTQALAVSSLSQATAYNEFTTR